jgi:hypothetical protein
MITDRVARGIAPAIIALAVLGTSRGGGHAQEAKPQLSWYGYIKLDASWDESLLSAGNFARWVVSPDQFEEHSHFNMTARQTRIGVNLSSKAGSATIAGRWESDFYGESAENKNSLQVRHAFVEVTWPSGWALLAGQASDVISPLAPATLNYTVAWWAGNIGYRRPQLRLTRRFALGGNRELRLQAAATRTIGDDFTAAEPGDAGADAGSPTFQGLASLALPLAESRVLTLGGWIHRGDENLHRQLGGEDENDVASWSVGGFLTLPAGQLTFSGEAWTGGNLDDYLGGVGHGILVSRDVATTVESTGGWAEVALRQGTMKWSAGAGIDDPVDDDLGPGFRARNLVGWTNLTRDFGGGLSAGLEISRWETSYVGLAKGSSFRVHGAVIYTF